MESGGSHTGAIWAPRGHLIMSGDIFDCHNQEEAATGIEWVEARAAAGHPAVPRTKEFSCPKQQQGCG